MKFLSQHAWLIGMALALLALSAEAAAAVRPPTPQQVDSPPLWLYYLILIVLTGATVALSILPSKRSHQD